MTRTTCPYCGVGCGILVGRDATGAVTIAGDPDHPANRGRLCSKGLALAETLDTAPRLLAPRIFGQQTGWDDALSLVARRFARTIARHGPESVALYCSGQMLTEDYYVANKLMKGFIGSANIDTNSRLCMASSVAAHRRAFGSDTVPGLYEDLEQADLVVLVGANLAWCHPVLFQRLAAARAARPDLRLVVIDPRRSATAELADLHLPIAPGSDAALFNALLAEIDRRGAADPAFARHLTGSAAAIAAARADNPALTGLPPETIARFLDLWIGTPRVVTLWSQGINQSESGTDKVNAILNCHLLTGRIGRPGMGPFSVTGQPNAMGGREVGGLSNMLACHLSLEDPAHRAAVQGFWASPAMPDRPGLKAVDMFQAVSSGRIKAIWIIHTNPAATLPEADAVRDALSACPFVVVSDVTAATDTARLAHVLLPATAWGEKEGTVTNSDRTISRQRAFLPAPGQARPDWAILAGVARRMGWDEAFAWESPAEILAEHARLSGIAGALGGDFDISDLATLTEAGYAALNPFTWPRNPRRQGGRFFGDGAFHTPDGRARLVPVTARPPANRSDPAHPFRLNTGRIRDQWHTMTRSGTSPRLSQHLAEPFLELHPADAARMGIAPATLVQVSNPRGRVILRALLTDRVPEGHPFAPIHWTGETAARARIGALVPAVTDPLSGQPESKGAPVALGPFPALWYGFAVSTRPFRPDSDYWALARCTEGWRAELAGLAPPADWLAHARALFGLPPETPAQSLVDRKQGLARIAFVEAGRLVAALFVAPEPVALSRDHLAGRLGQPPGPVLAGRPGGEAADPGPVVCACRAVGLNTIRAALASGQARNLEGLGAALGAGTSCGSCRPDLARLIAEAPPATAPVREAAE